MVLILTGVFCLIAIGACAAVANLLRRYTVMVFRGRDRRWIDLDA